MERTPGRNWINTGYGANVQSVDFGSPSGGRGKPVKMFVQPFSSPPVIGMRSGAYNGGYPMCIVYPRLVVAKCSQNRSIPGFSLSMRKIEITQNPCIALARLAQADVNQSLSGN
jgi:hypothetical protein